MQISHGPFSRFSKDIMAVGTGYSKPSRGYYYLITVTITINLSQSAANFFCPTFVCVCERIPSVSLCFMVTIISGLYTLRSAKLRRAQVCHLRRQNDSSSVPFTLPGCGTGPFCGPGTIFLNGNRHC